MRLALYEPDIPQNTGTILRTCACLGIPVDIIEPAGFSLSDKALRRAGLDYIEQAILHRHQSFQIFEDWRRGAGHRLILATTHAAQPFTEAQFRPGDIILMGRESAGVPDRIVEAADLAVRIPVRAGLRSLNVAVAAGIILSEALRQTGGFNQP